MCSAVAFRRIFTSCLLLCCSLLSLAEPIVGAARTDVYLPLLRGASVGLVVNHSARVGDTHLLDLLLSHEVAVKAILTPEHGFRGIASAGEGIEDSTDAATGVAIFSLYGAHKKPTPDMLEGIEVLLFDMQDVGARFYTYLSTLHYVMEAAAELRIPLIVLDRPNPNGRFVAGPVLEASQRSFVGMHPIPVLHGMTLGELAQMIKDEGWSAKAEDLQLTVIPLLDYQRQVPYVLPVSPSPNLPNAHAVQLYPSLCLFEGTAVSLGRGTDWPFQLIAHDKVKLGEWVLTPTSRPSAKTPKFQDSPIYTADLRQSRLQGFDLSLLISTYQTFKATHQPFFTHPAFFDKLAGTDTLRLAIEAGQDWETIEASWQEDIEAFKQRRRKYLLYGE